MTWDRVMSDVAAAPSAVWSDARGFYTDPGNLPPLVGLGLFALAAERYESEEERWLDGFNPYGKSVSDQIELLGDGGVLLAGSLLLGATSWIADLPREYEASKTLGESLLLTGANTLLLKLVIPDSRPNGAAADFPSGHSSMSAAAATALWREYGPWVGVPAALGAGAVGLQRLESNHHDIGAVLFGWTLGFLSATAVADRRDGLGTVYTLEAFADDRGAGLGVTFRF